MATESARCASILVSHRLHLEVVLLKVVLVFNLLLVEGVVSKLREVADGAGHIVASVLMETRFIGDATIASVKDVEAIFQSLNRVHDKLQCDFLVIDLRLQDLLLIVNSLSQLLNQHILLFYLLI